MKIVFATGTRADWGLLSPVAKALRNRQGFDVRILVTNMHLLPQFGNTIAEIEADGFDTSLTVPMPEGDSPLDRAIAMATCLEGSARRLQSVQPDMVVILGDRYEMLAVASAATMLSIPIVHLHGGELSYGAIDDNIRHAISKLAALHFTSTENARSRLLAMGEMPCRVINSGAIGVWNFCRRVPMPKAELEQSLGISLDHPYLLVTFHPATLDSEDPATRCRAMLDALDRFPELRLVITYPNNDQRSEGIIRLIRQYAADNPERALLIPSLGMPRYLSLLRHVKAVVGNSSSGIIEVPSAGIPTVNIGIRQLGRDRAPSVIDCGDSTEDIYHAIKLALSPEFSAMAAKADNPYHKPDTLQIITDMIADTDPAQLKTKKFHHICSDRSL